MSLHPDDRPKDVIELREALLGKRTHPIMSHRAVQALTFQPSHCSRRNNSQLTPRWVCS
ncbi:hypothetical protein [Candidatus Villigracilis affinis]|uniref:hypothetical protein n=1 Tax=Candidatus Villigracilis affinis TaxID=3140682 RepID=UPI001D59ED11|nr:hypothetical protein [Anaerolineales bacterium]